jgi:hypothetical protein
MARWPIVPGILDLEDLTAGPTMLEIYSTLPGEASTSNFGERMPKK